MEQLGPPPAPASGGTPQSWDAAMAQARPLVESLFVGEPTPAAPVPRSQPAVAPPPPPPPSTDPENSNLDARAIPSPSVPSRSPSGHVDAQPPPASQPAKGKGKAGADIPEPPGGKGKGRDWSDDSSDDPPPAAPWAPKPAAPAPPRGRPTDRWAHGRGGSRTPVAHRGPSVRDRGPSVPLNPRDLLRRDVSPFSGTGLAQFFQPGELLEVHETFDTTPAIGATPVWNLVASRYGRSLAEAAVGTIFLWQPTSKLLEPGHGMQGWSNLPTAPLRMIKRKVRNGANVFMNVEHPDFRPACREVRQAAGAVWGCSCFMCTFDKVSIADATELLRSECMEIHMAMAPGQRPYVYEHAQRDADRIEARLSRHPRPRGRRAAAPTAGSRGRSPGSRSPVEHNSRRETVEGATPAPPNAADPAWLRWFLPPPSLPRPPASQRAPTPLPRHVGAQLDRRHGWTRGEPIPPQPKSPGLGPAQDRAPSPVPRLGTPAPPQQPVGPAKSGPTREPNLGHGTPSPRSTQPAGEAPRPIRRLGGPGGLECPECPGARIVARDADQVRDDPLGRAFRCSRCSSVELRSVKSSSPRAPNLGHGTSSPHSAPPVQKQAPKAPPPAMPRPTDVPRKSTQWMDANPAPPGFVAPEVPTQEPPTRRGLFAAREAELAAAPVLPATPRVRPDAIPGESREPHRSRTYSNAPRDPGFASSGTSESDSSSAAGLPPRDRSPSPAPAQAPPSRDRSPSPAPAQEPPLRGIGFRVAFERGDVPAPTRTTSRRRGRTPQRRDEPTPPPPPQPGPAPAPAPDGPTSVPWLLPGPGWPWDLIHVKYYEEQYGRGSYVHRLARFIAMLDEKPDRRRTGQRNENKYPIRDGLGADMRIPDYLAFADAAFRQMKTLRSRPGYPGGILSDWIAESGKRNGWSLEAMGYVPAERHLPLIHGANPDPWRYVNGKAVSAEPVAPPPPSGPLPRPWIWSNSASTGDPRPRPSRPAPAPPGGFPTANRHLRERGLTGVPRGPDDDLPLGSRGTYFAQQAEAANPDEPGDVGYRTRFRERARDVFRNMTSPDELFPGAPAKELCICWQWTKDPTAQCRFGAGRRGGCFYLHRCSFIGEDGLPCQNPFPCRAIEHYWLYVDTYGHPPRWYNPTQADLDYCATQEELRVLARPASQWPGAYAWGRH